MSNPLVCELNFGMGNIRSLQKAFEHLGQPVQVTDRADDIIKADAVLLPGDGAFGRAMSELQRLEMVEAVREFHQAQKPILGICIGFQLLFDSSNEFGSHKGLGFLNGGLRRLDAPGKPVPHMGWSETRFVNAGRLNQGIPEKVYFYYVHSFCVPGVHDSATAASNYGEDFTAVVEKDNLFGTQFHPEKSQRWGLKILENFISILRN